MHIVIVSDWFSEIMGYAENLLPKALAKAGHQVTVVTSDLQPPLPNYDETYKPFLGPRKQPTGRKTLHGYRLIRLKSGTQRHGIYLKGFQKTLTDLNPDLIQTFTIPSISTYQSLRAGKRLRIPVFLEEHLHQSVFNQNLNITRRLSWSMYRLLWAPWVNRRTTHCYAIAPDVQEVAEQFIGLHTNKISICSLGVDTDIFSPSKTPEDTEQRKVLRKRLGFTDHDRVVIYTGRFSEDKGAVAMAQAIDLLQDQHGQIKALFVGAGPKEDVAKIQQCKGCVIHPFVHFPELPAFYRAADYACWPKQESTSQLDAAAVGLPLVLSHRISVADRVKGNGLMYDEPNINDLAAKLLQLITQEDHQTLSQHGIEKIKARYSWDHIAKQRIEDYQRAINQRR